MAHVCAAVTKRSHRSSSSLARRCNSALRAASCRQVNQAVTQFIGELEAMSYEHEAIVAERSLREWMDWAKSRLAKQDPLARGVSGLFNAL